MAELRQVMGQDNNDANEQSMKPSSALALGTKASLSDGFMEVSAAVDDPSLDANIQKQSMSHGSRVGDSKYNDESSVEAQGSSDDADVDQNTRARSRKGMGRRNEVEEQGMDPRNQDDTTAEIVSSDESDRNRQALSDRKTRETSDSNSEDWNDVVGERDASSEGGTGTETNARRGNDRLRNRIGAARDADGRPPRQRHEDGELGRREDGDIGRPPRQRKDGSDSGRDRQDDGDDVRPRQRYADRDTGRERRDDRDNDRPPRRRNDDREPRRDMGARKFDDDKRPDRKQKSVDRYVPGCVCLYVCVHVCLCAHMYL